MTLSYVVCDNVLTKKAESERELKMTKTQSQTRSQHVHGDHTHECRECGATIECDYDSDTCDRIGGWSGGSDGCEYCE